ncbi:MAG TPA: beta-ketoacyl synthase N-terminal-like domain-containing protein [Stellaceae bacterium]|jgi:acyl transferase domain-containing protein/acyl carrier protein
MPDTERQSREQSAVRRALAMIEDLQARLAASGPPRDAPIAIVGLGCRFPGATAGAEAYWRLLADGHDAIAEVPPTRWDVARYYDPDPDRPGKTNSRWGGFLTDIDMFDAGLFGISRREAESMDPQHRLLLEVAWEALEHAGIAPDALAGSPTGIFVGLSSSDYSTLLGAGRDASWIDAYASLGNAPSIAAGRLAYAFGTQGPAMVVDTACSSSLVAAHLAAQALRSGECSLALAGGVNLILAPELTINFSKAHMLAADGRCKTFDAAADGYVRAEGCGVVVLKLLSDARAAGDRVLAVLRGSAVNQDGRSAGLTAPNGPAQAAVIRAALANGGVAPERVGYLEAHGTGTALGDPIEMHALKAVFGGRERPLFVGSVKSNIGHAEAAAGVAGLIKAVLMLGHGAVPASLHFNKLNPHIDLGDAPLVVPTALQALPELASIGVSSFGFSGTNAHLVVERAPSEPERPADPRPVHVLALSARDPAGLEALAARWERALAAPGADLAALCHTAGAGRARHSQRLAVVAADAATARAALREAAAESRAAGPVRVGFLVTGQGASYAGMAAGLVSDAPVFAEIIARCDQAMGLDRKLAAVFADGAALARTEYAQPALYALSAGLGALWRSWGIEPVAVLGHSLGEYAAAHLAGVFSLEDGARLVAARGRLMGALPAGGGMAVLLGAGGERVAARHPGVEISGFNSRTALTVAGPAAALEALLADPELEARGILGQRLELGQAFHSRLMEPVLDDLARAAAIAHHDPALPVVGSLTGEIVTRYDAAYWRAHARQPVRFADGLASLARLGCTHLVELGAQPVLCGFARFELPQLPALPSLARPRPGETPARQDWANLLSTLAQLWRDGAPVDWAGHDRPYRPPVADAPTYPFQRQRYWFHPATAAREDGALAGERIELASGAVLFRGRLDPQRLPYLWEHVVLGETIVPGAHHLAALLAATGSALRDVAFTAPLRLPPDGCNTQLLLTGDRIELFADAGGAWRQHANATVEPPLASPPPLDLAGIVARLPEDPDGPAALHATLAQRGIALGPTFRGVQRLFRGDGEVLVEVALPDGAAPLAPLHPAQLDAAFQAVAVTFREGDRSGAFLPLAVDRVVLHRPFAGPFWAYLRVRPAEGATGETATGDVMLANPQGVPIATVAGLTFKRIEDSAVAAPDPTERWSYRVEWAATAPSAALPPPDRLAALAATARDMQLPPAAPGLAEGLERLAGAYAANARAEVAPAEVIPGFSRLYAHLSNLAMGADDDPERLAAALSARHGERLEIALACRSGRALPQVLRGEADPLVALFGDGDGDGAAIYADPPFARMLSEMVVAGLRGAAAALPAGRRLRVVEIGGGTGAVLAALCAAVPAERFEFTFTDISPAFVDAAKSRFGGALAHCGPLDIERASDRQGFPAGGFDVVVAANVLHATRDLRDSLRHAARLLAPGGILLLLEQVKPSNWSDLVFGSTPGWWRFADAALRPGHPLLNETQWRGLLAERFAEIASVGSPGGEQMLAIARGPLPERETVVWEAEAGLPALDLATATLRVVQDALARPSPPALRLVTRSAQPVGTSPVAAEQGALLGFGRVVAIEHPELDCRLVDLPPGAPAGLAAEAPSGTTEAAWRDGVWHVPRLARASLPGEPGFATGGTQLITGGLGGLGPRLAEWLLQSGAERVVLMGRAGHPELALPDGVEIMLGDVAEASAVAQVVAAIDAAGPPLRGVFHLAGVLSDAALLTLTRDQLAQVFAGKVDGARNLDAVLGARPLDAFVLFGSSVGLTGNAGQAAHAAANAYLGALAQQRRQRGLAGLCVDWGAWGEAGTLTRSSIGERLVAAGAELMPPGDALRALGRAIVSGEARVMIAAFDWSRFLAGFGSAMPQFFAAVAPQRRAAIMPRAAGVEPRASLAALAAFVVREARLVLRAGPDETLPPDLPLNEAGLDSLMALELRKALAQGLGLELPATLLFNFPTIDALTAHLASLTGLGDTAASDTGPKPSPAAAPEAVVSDVMRMSEEEMAAVIAREFAWSVASHG